MSDPCREGKGVEVNVLAQRAVSLAVGLSGKES